MTTTELKEEVIKQLQDGKKLTMKWDCGNDEAFAYIFVDGKEIDFTDDFGEGFSMYLVDYLKIPDAGEFTIEGEGVIFEENGKIFIDYESTAASYLDEDTAAWVVEQDPELAFSGKKQLFK